MFGGRIYTVVWDAATAISASIDVFEIAPTAGKPVLIHELKMWQTTDLGDTAEEVILVDIRRGYTSSGSVGGTPTVAKRYSGDSTAGFTAECRNTTLATTTTPDIVHSDGWNIRIPYIWTPTPEMRPFCDAQQSRIVVRIPAPTDAITMNASLVVEEIG